MKWVFTVIVIFSVGVLAALGFGRWGPSANRSQDLHLSMGPRLEQIRRLAKLVTLRIPVGDVQVSRLSGRTGGVSLVLIVHGDVEVGVDLQKARLLDVDELAKSARILLPAPTFHRPRLNHDRTIIYRLNYSGSWRIIPGSAGQLKLINDAMRKTQRLLVVAIRQADVLDDARYLTEQIICRLFTPTGWRIDVQWEGDSPITLTDESPSAQ